MPALLTEIFELVLIPLLTVVAGFLVNWLRLKSKQIISGLNNEQEIKYIEMITQTITTCVTATNQTYVESLKKQGKFDMEAQKIAFQNTYDNVLSILSQDAKDYIQSAVGDLNLYLTEKIEQTVSNIK